MALPLTASVLPAHAEPGITGPNAAGVTGEWPTSSCKPWVYIGENGGRACFQKYGDKFFVGDTLPDGYTIVLSWETSYGRTGTCVAAGYFSWGMTMCDENVKERSAIKFKLEGVNSKGRVVGNTPWTHWLPTGS